MQLYTVLLYRSCRFFVIFLKFCYFLKVWSEGCPIQPPWSSRSFVELKGCCLWDQKSSVSQGLHWCILAFERALQMDTFMRQEYGCPIDFAWFSVVWWSMCCGTPIRFPSIPIPRLFCLFDSLQWLMTSSELSWAMERRCRSAFQPQTRF